MGVTRVFVWSVVALTLCFATQALFVFALLRFYGPGRVDDGLDALEATRPVLFLIAGAVVLLCNWRLASKANRAPLAHVAVAFASIFSLYVGLSYMITNRKAAVILEFVDTQMLFTMLIASMFGYALSRWKSR